MSIKTLIQNFNGNIQQAAASFIVHAPPKTLQPKKTPSTPTKSQKNIPLTQTMSLSELLNQKGKQETPIKRTPTKGKLPPKPPLPKKTPTKAARI